MNILALLSLGLLTGNEFSIGAFTNPSLARLDWHQQAPMRQPMARLLGRVMPFWMAGTLALLGLATWRAQQKRPFWLASALLLALVIAWSVTLPVPINNRVSKWELDTLPFNWRDELRTFDFYHQVRVVALLASLLCALRGASSPDSFIS